MEALLSDAMPHSVEAERSVLGAMLIDSDALEQMLEILRPQDFYVAAHECIFTAILDIRDQGGAVDLVTLHAMLEKRGLIERVGGAVYLSELMQFVPTAANAQYYAGIVEDKSVQRALIKAGSETMRDGRDDDRDVDVSLDAAERRIYDISMRKGTDSLTPASEIIPDTMIEIGEIVANAGKLTGVATGFVELDRLTHGLQPSDLIIVAARPAMGKSAFALNIAQYAAVRDNRSVVYFSLEMNKQQLMIRALCTEAAVDAQKMREGRISEDDMEALQSKAGPLSDSKLYIDDSSGLTVAQCRSKCRRLKAQRGLDLVIIDYMQLMQGTGVEARKNDNRQQEVSDMTRALKLMARELGVPVMLLAQLNRGPEQRATNDHRPMIADLRESGSIEQDADIVILLYRQQVYDATKDNTSEVIVAKHRHGPTGTVKLAWQGEYTRFVNPLIEN